MVPDKGVLGVDVVSCQDLKLGSRQHFKNSQETPGWISSCRLCLFHGHGFSHAGRAVTDTA